MKRRWVRAEAQEGAETADGRRGKDPLDSALEKITLKASSFAWAHGKLSISGFQASGCADARATQRKKLREGASVHR